MSVIVVIKNKDSFDIGADARASGDYAYYDFKEEPFKLLKLDNGIVIGICGDPGISEIARKVFSVCEDFDEELLRQKYIFNLRQTLINLNQDDLKYELVVAYKDSAFVIYDGGGVNKIHNVMALGSGRESALGYLYGNLGSSINKKELVKEAVRVSSKIVHSVSSCGWYINTNELVFEAFE